MEQYFTDRRRPCPLSTLHIQVEIQADFYRVLNTSYQRSVLPEHDLTYRIRLPIHMQLHFHGLSLLRYHPLFLQSVCSYLHVIHVGLWVSHWKNTPSRFDSLRLLSLHFISISWCFEMITILIKLAERNKLTVFGIQSACSPQSRKKLRIYNHTNRQGYISQPRILTYSPMLMKIEILLHMGNSQKAEACL